MPKQPIGRLCHERASWWDLWSLYRRKLPCNQSGVCQLLLADTQDGHPWFHKEMQMMLRVYKHSTHPSWQSPQLKLPLALCHVWNGHNGTIAKSPRSNQIFTSRYQLLHQVDWGKTTMRNHSQRGGEVYLVTPHMKVWPPWCNCHQERHPSESSGLWRLPNEARSQAPHKLNQTSPDQWSCKGSQQIHP